MIGEGQRGVGGRAGEGGACPGGVAVERPAAVDEGVSGALNETKSIQKSIQ